jgi:hypothetical protein
MTITQFCVFEPGRPYVHDFHPTIESANTNATRLRDETGRDYLAGDFAIWEAEYSLRARDGFKLARITEQFYHQMLNCLPPMYHSGSIGFFLSERETGTITAQFVVSGAHYYGGFIDLSDRSTWITPEKIDALDSQAEPLAWFPARDTELDPAPSSVS